MRTFLDSVLRDLRYAGRGFLRTPLILFTALPIVALAIGATTAVFSLMDALAFRPMAVPSPERLVDLHHAPTEAATGFSEFSFPDYIDLRDQATAFEQLTAFRASRCAWGKGWT